MEREPRRSGHRDAADSGAGRTVVSGLSAATRALAIDRGAGCQGRRRRGSRWKTKRGGAASESNACARGASSHFEQEAPDLGRAGNRGVARASVLATPLGLRLNRAAAFAGSVIFTRELYATPATET